MSGTMMTIIPLILLMHLFPEFIMFIRMGNLSLYNMYHICLRISLFPA